MVFNFTEHSDVSNWRIVDDVVMGGRSSGNFSLTPNGHGLFKGSVSLENNGGFSSVRCNIGKIEMKDYTTLKIRVKGDGKKYQIRIKARARDYFSYVTYIETSSDWEIIEVPLQDFYASFRGRRVNYPNFSEDYMEEIGFLFGNKKAEDFALEIDYIQLK